ncbi:methyltransferase TYW3-domain-containing protein [Powellomyces hirtus]|nr:methyltransferase TYW3-domain-containing protein [Powellomyces hirtus]
MLRTTILLFRHRPISIGPIRAAPCARALSDGAKTPILGTAPPPITANNSRNKNSFDARKAALLAYTIDKSPKGSIDEPIVPLLRTINQCTHYVTTSSCSGRVAIYVDAPLQHLVPAKVRKGGTWLFVTHSMFDDTTTVKLDTITTLFSGTDGTLRTVEFNSAPPQTESQPIVYFKFEPFILHVQCRDDHAAQQLLRVALRAGYVNSGIQGLHVQVRGTMKVDVPLGWVEDHHDGMSQGGVGRRQTVHLGVSREYVAFLCRMANEKFVRNGDMYERFRREVVAEWEGKADELCETKEERRERKKHEGLHVQAELRRLMSDESNSSTAGDTASPSNSR